MRDVLHARAEWHTIREDELRLPVTKLLLTAGLIALVSVMPAGAQQVTVNFLSDQPPETFAAAIAAFEAANPDIKIASERVPSDSMNAQVEARLSAKDPGIDVYAVDSPRVPAMAARGYLLNLESLHAAIDAVTDEPGRSAITYNGEYWALPLWTSTQMLFYNVDLLSNAGIPAPSSAEADRLTWEQVVDLATKAQAAGAEKGLALEQGASYYQLQSLFESAGAGPGLTGPDLLTPDLANPKWIETAEWYKKLFEDGLAPRGIPGAQINALFTDGKMPFYVGGPWNLANFQKSGVNYGVAAVPYFEGGKPITATGSWAIGISPFTDQLDAAKKFAEFITLDPEGSYLTAKDLPIPPVNLEAFKTYIDKLATIDPVVGPMVREVMTYELAHTAVARPRSIGYVAFEEILNKAFSDIRNGADVKSTLESAQAQVTSAVSRL